MLRGKQRLIVATFISIMLMGAGQLWAQTITVGSVAAQAGGRVSISVAAGAPESIQGAAFTVNFNTDWLTLTNVSSPFFVSFAEQYTGDQANVPTEVTVDGVTYVRPLVINQLSDGVMLAALNLQAGSQEEILFTLEFELAADIPDGVYPVSVGTTFIKDTSAGYPEQGLAVPLVYPVVNTSVINGRISVNSSMVDSDGDGIDDTWEMDYFGNLTTATAISDFDRDGYTDLQEYLNQMSNITDSNGNIFDPKVDNSTGGIGYIMMPANSAFWTKMIPLIIEMGKNR